MKKLAIAVTFLGVFLLLAPAARADYSFSISYGYPNLHRDHDACTHNPGRGIACGRSRGVARFSYPRHYKPHPNYQTRIVYVNRATPTKVVTREARVESREKLGISDIVILSKAGVSDAVIIEKIQNTGSVFDLSVEEVEALRREGVSSLVINYMLDTAR